MELTRSEVSELEELLNQRGLKAILIALAEICQAKHDSFQSSDWQTVDTVLAYRWRFAADNFACLATLRAYDL